MVHEVIQPRGNFTANHLEAVIAYKVRSVDDGDKYFKGIEVEVI